MGMGKQSLFSFLAPRARRHDPIVAASSSMRTETGLGDLPESCMAAVMMHLDPPQVCRLAMVNRVFRSASDADFVWESKLPMNYGDVIDRVFKEEEFVWKGSCKRDIYSKLCTPKFFDDGTKKVWLDKSSGKTCMLVSSNGLSITGIEDRRYWSRIPTDESMFSSVAYLRQIWWFEVDGEIDFPFPPGSYSLFFRIQLGRSHRRRFGGRSCKSEHVHGWDKKPVIFQVSTQEGHTTTKQCYLREEPGKWIHCHAGDFSVTNSSSGSTKIKFSMTQTDCTHTKGGLCVDSVVIYPVESREMLECSSVNTATRRR